MFFGRPSLPAVVRTDINVIERAVRKRAHAAELYHSMSDISETFSPRCLRIKNAQSHRIIHRHTEINTRTHTHTNTWPNYNISRLQPIHAPSLTARRTLIDDATQAGGPGVRLAAVIGGSGAGGYPHGGSGGEMVETTSAYANAAADGVDNFGYARDGDGDGDHRHHRRTSTDLRQQQHLLQPRGTDTKRTVKPVIHFPKPPAGSPSSRYGDKRVQWRTNIEPIVIVGVIYRKIQEEMHIHDISIHIHRHTQNGLTMCPSVYIHFISLSTTVR